jgi:hypothetical protein
MKGRGANLRQTWTGWLVGGGSRRLLFFRLSFQIQIARGRGAWWGCMEADLEGRMTCADIALLCLQIHLLLRR